MTAHARLGASSAHRWMRCPASVRAELAYPDTSSPAAASGTDAHELASVCLLNGEVDASSYLGLPVVDVFGHAGESGAATVPAEWVDSVNVYLEHVWKLSTPEAERYVEERLSLEALRPDMFGTADCLLLYPEQRKITVVDFKHGFAPVDATENPQLKFYALAAYVRFDNVKAETVDVVIVQPRAVGAPPVKTVSFSALELSDFMMELLAAAEATDDPSARFVPGAHCKFCKHKSACAALASFAEAEAVSLFAPVPDMAPKAAAAGLSSEDLARRYLSLETVRQYVKAIEAEATARAKAEELPGLKWVRGRSAREWNADGDTIAAKIEADLGIDVRERVCPSPAQVEKILGKKHFKTLEPALVQKRAGSPKLVGMDDDRPAVTPTADDWKTADFAPIVDG